MTESDRPAFLDLMLGLGETYNQAVSDVRMEIYFRVLRDLSFEDVNRLAMAHIRTNKFFPVPAELREQTPKPDPRSQSMFAPGTSTAELVAGVRKLLAADRVKEPR